MKSEELAMPMLIQDVGHVTPESVDKFFLPKIKSGQAKENEKQLRPEVNTLFHYGDSHFGGYFITPKDQSYVAYFVQYKPVRYSKLGLNALRQALVWRKRRGDEIATSMPLRVFFDVLLPKFGQIVSDYEQTEFGRDFWLRAVDAAFDKGLFVYVVNRIGKDGDKLIRLDSFADLVDLKDFLWAPIERNKRVLILISNKELKEVK